MTEKEKGEFIIGADKPGESADKVRVFRRIPESAAEREAHVARLTERDAEAMGGIRAMIEHIPAGPASEPEKAWGQAQVQGDAGRLKLEPEEADKMRAEIAAKYGARQESGEKTAIVQRPEEKKGLWQKLFSKK